MSIQFERNRGRFHLVNKRQEAALSPLGMRRSCFDSRERLETVRLAEEVSLLACTACCFCSCAVVGGEML